MDADLHKISELFQDDKLLQAARLVQKLENDLEQVLSDTSLTPEAEHSAREIRSKFSAEPYRTIRNQCAEVLALRRSLSSEEGWISSYDSPDTKVWYRREQNTASHSILIEGQIHAPLVNVAALIYECDLYHKLFWYVNSSVELQLRNPSRFKRAAHISVYAPWPLYDRDVVVHAFAVDALDEDDSILVISRSLKQSDEPEDDVPGSGNRIVRVDMYNSGFELGPSSPGVTKARFVYNVDPHLSFVPMTLINWGARTFCRYSLRLLENRAKNLDKLPSQYKERLATRSVYDFIRDRLSEYWASKGHTKDSIQTMEDNATNDVRRNDSFDPDAVPKGPPKSVITSLLRSNEAGGSSSRRGGTLSRFFSASVFV